MEGLRPLAVLPLRQSDGRRLEATLPGSPTSGCLAPALAPALAQKHLQLAGSPALGPGPSPASLSPAWHGGSSALGGRSEHVGTSRLC